MKPIASFCLVIFIALCVAAFAAVTLAAIYFLATIFSQS
jgi:hypothetical protein